MRLWAAVCLALYVAFWLELDNPFWAGTSAAIVCQPQLGASLRKGWFRMIGTLVGAVAIVVLTACFPQDRALFLVGLALWGAACALAATLLRNFAAYSAALAGYTAAIIASDQLGATGGLDGRSSCWPSPASARSGSASSVQVSYSQGPISAERRAGWPRYLPPCRQRSQAASPARLAQAGSDLAQTQSMRRELIRHVTALDPTIDEALGESSDLRYHSRVLQAAVDGLFAALAGWRRWRCAHAVTT